MVTGCVLIARSSVPVKVLTGLVGLVWGVFVVSFAVPLLSPRSFPVTGASVLVSVVTVTGVVLSCEAGTSAFLVLFIAMLSFCLLLKRNWLASNAAPAMTITIAAILNQAIGFLFFSTNGTILAPSTFLDSLFLRSVRCISASWPAAA